MDMNLRGVILQRFPSATAFGKEMGWGRQKASNIMNGRTQPSAEDMIAIAQKVGIDDARSFMDIFFPTLSIK